MRVRQPKWAKESSDVIVLYMMRNNVRVNRHNYVGLNWMGDKDAGRNLGAECESEMPKQLQWKRRRSR